MAQQIEVDFAASCVSLDRLQAGSCGNSGATLAIVFRLIYGVSRLLYRIIIPRRFRAPETRVLPPLQ
jgi:hypothetical protein